MQNTVLPSCWEAWGGPTPPRVLVRCFFRDHVRPSLHELCGDQDICCARGAGHPTSEFVEDTRHQDLGSVPRLLFLRWSNKVQARRPSFPFNTDPYEIYSNSRRRLRSYRAWTGRLNSSTLSPAPPSRCAPGVEERRVLKVAMCAHRHSFRWHRSLPWIAKGANLLRPAVALFAVSDPRAASFRSGGRHHLVMAGGIIPLRRATLSRFGGRPGISIPEDACGGDAAPERRQWGESCRSARIPEVGGAIFPRRSFRAIISKTRSDNVTPNFRLP